MTDIKKIIEQAQCIALTKDGISSLASELTISENELTEIVATLCKQSDGHAAAGFKDIMVATSANQKYFHLAQLLEKQGILKLPEGIEELLYPAPRAGVNAQLKQIVIAQLNPEIRMDGI